MAKPILALNRLPFDDSQGKVIYPYAKSDGECEEFDHLARITNGARPRFLCLPLWALE
jgi:hypothetical protein